MTEAAASYSARTLKQGLSGSRCSATNARTCAHDARTCAHSRLRWYRGGVILHISTEGAAGAAWRSMRVL